MALQKASQSKVEHLEPYFFRLDVVDPASRQPAMGTTFVWSWALLPTRLEEPLRQHPKAIAAFIIPSVFLATHAYRVITKRRAERADFALNTAMDDLDALPSPLRGGRRRKIAGTAVVVGGSVVGLLTARICADHFERVVVIESDQGADTEFPRVEEEKRDQHGNKTITSRRPRVAQTFQLHMYQPFSLLTLRRLFPDFDQTFTSLGGRVKPWTFNAWCTGTHIGLPSPAFSHGRGLPYHHNLRELCATFVPGKDGAGGYPLQDTISCTRANLEIWLRRMVLDSRPEIEFVKGTVTGLEKSDESAIIAGVIYHPSAEKGIRTEQASLVVDCTGHSKAGAKWLEHLGYGPIPQLSYDPQIRYATVWFDFPTSKLPDLPIPDELRDMEVYIYAFEDASVGHKAAWAHKGDNGIFGLTVGGFGLSSADIPRTPEEWKEFYHSMNRFDGKSMPEWFVELIDYLARNVGWERATFEETRAPPSVFVKYHELAGSLPSNFVVLGDAVMRTSPVYGLGITKGMVGAVTLAGALNRATRQTFWNRLLGLEPSLPNGFADDVMKRQNDRTGWLWTQSKESDYAHETTVPCDGETLEVGTTTRDIVREMMRRSGEDDEAAAAFYYARLFTYPNTLEVGKRAFVKAMTVVNAKKA